MGAEEEIKALRITVESNTKISEKVLASMRGLEKVSDSFERHERFLQDIVRDSFTHQRKQDDKVLDFLLGKLGWVISVVLAAAFGAKMTGVI